MWQGFHAASAAPEALNHDCKVTGNQNHRVAVRDRAPAFFHRDPKDTALLMGIPRARKAASISRRCVKEFRLDPLPSLAKCSSVLLSDR